MKQNERDELLIRIDERLKGLKDGDDGDIPEIKRSIGKQNGRIRKLEITVACIIVGGGGYYGVLQLFGG